MIASRAAAADWDRTIIIKREKLHFNTLKKRVSRDQNHEIEVAAESKKKTKIDWIEIDMARMFRDFQLIETYDSWQIFDSLECFFENVAALRDKKQVMLLRSRNVQHTVMWDEIITTLSLSPANTARAAYF